MSKQKCIVTITDGISPTSMPFNEFIRYRLKHYPDEKQVLIQVFEKGVDSNVKIPDDVEFYSLGTNLSKIYSAIRSLNKKYDIKTYHIHEGKSVILFSVATLLAHRAKCVYTLHSTFCNYPLHNKVFSFVASLLARKVACVSKTSFKYYPAILKKLRGKNVMPIQNGVDTERVDLVNAENIHQNDVFTLTYVARLVGLKRHKMLFDILAGLPHCRLQLIGSGPLENELREYAISLGIQDRVDFVGLLPREEVYRRLKSTDIYVSTSSYEGLPIGVLEAMACKAVCVVSDIEQHTEISEKCENLVTVPSNIGTWQSEISRIMQMSQNEKNRIREQNARDVKSYFSLKRMHLSYDALYDTLNE